MTATRIARLATLTVLVALWLGAAAALWQTQVPAALEVERVRADALLSHVELERRERHARFLRVAGALALALQLAALVALTRRVPSVRGAALLRATQLGALVGAALVVVRLPVDAAVLWWQRRYDIALLGYGAWLRDQLRPLVLTALVGAVAAAVAVALARRIGSRWWIAGGPAVVAIGAAVVLAQPLTTPRLEPVGRPGLVQDVERLARRQGLGSTRVELRRAAKRTRLINAEALGVGPTTRVVFWDTALRIEPGALRVLAAHELAHVSRRHLWKGLAWFALFAIPAVILIARLTHLELAEQVPRAALLAALITLAVTPLANAVSRRYEAEADWVALETTRDARSARVLLRELSAASVSDPDPPWWSRQLFGTHPALVERLGLIDAWQRRSAR